MPQNLTVSLLKDLQCDYSIRKQGYGSLYWVPSDTGILDPPVVGSFDNDIGHFFCKDTFNGKEIIMLFRWDMRDRSHPVWSQAFSPDKGKTWEWNWINVSYRID